MNNTTIAVYASHTATEEAVKELEQADTLSIVGRPEILEHHEQKGNDPVAWEEGGVE